MIRRKTSLDRLFLGLIIALSISGAFIYSSASLGIISSGMESYLSVISKQVFFGFVLGFIALYLTSTIDYRFWQERSSVIFGLSIIAALLVFLPGIGMDMLGAKRWIDLGFITFQPAEFLKFGFICFFAAWLHKNKQVVPEFGRGFLTTLFIIAIPGVILLAQPDTGTLLSIIAAGLAMYLIGGGKWRHFWLFFMIALAGILCVAYLRPYAMSRIETFLDPGRDPLGSGYQARQALIAVGSGQMFGRGFGQSIQKFNFLPEPTGDAIFAVASEEFGFVGSTIIICLFLALLLRGLYIAQKTDDSFGRLLALGIVILITSQSFVNIGAMLGVLPLTGVPLIFISHGGTALLFALAEMGVVLNISKHTIKK